MRNAISTEQVSIPVIDAEELKEVLHSAFPSANFIQEIVNPAYDSWQLQVLQADKSIEFVWGPLSSFGGIHSQSATDENLFAYCDQYLHSIDDAIAFAHRYLCSGDDL